MNPFTFQCTTKIIFGKDTEKTIGSELKINGAKKVLLVYGGGSIKKIGLYDTVINSLKENSIEYVELSGVVPNPRVELVREGIEKCRENNIDFLLAVGGGSVIDTVKAISFGVYYDGDVWDLFSKYVDVGDKHIPIATILTIPAAGSEASTSCVISNEKLDKKAGFHSPYLRPVFSILNPELSYTLPSYQTACGCMDIMAHVMERYFTQTEHVELTDRLCESVLKTIIHNLPIVLCEPDNYDARAEIMWAGTIAHNDLVGTGRNECWFNHAVEHEFSAYYDIAHGAGLAIGYPAWMKFLSDKESCIKKLAQYSTNVWNVEYNYDNPKDTVSQGIERFYNFLKSCGLPVSYRDENISNEKFEQVADNLTNNGKNKIGGFYSFNRDEILQMLKIAE